MMIISVSVILGLSWLNCGSLASASTNLINKLHETAVDEARRLKRSPNGHIKFDESVEGPREGKARGGGPQTVLTKSLSDCGKQSIPFSQPAFGRVMTYIRDGRCAPYGSIPWSAEIQILKNGEYVHHCGGAIIDETHILTATHCFGSGMDAQLMKVVVGQNSLTVREDKELHFQIHSVHRHHQYQSMGPYSHDIALIRIKPKGDGRGIRFSDKVSAICLPSPQDVIKDDHKCIISGWGKTEPHGKIESGCLRAAHIPILNQKVCNKMYSFFSQPLLPHMVCAGYKQGGVDACKGDSGGPLACRMEDGRYKLIGIVSWGHGCGKANSPGVFTRVTTFLDWINEKQAL